MWFKTRVGLLSFSEQLEIVAYKFPDKPKWCVYAKVRGGPEGESKNLLGSSKIWAPSLYLAFFNDGPTVAAEIASVMDRIAVAAASHESLCDLSTAGHADAWAAEWHQIQWPSKH